MREEEGERSSRESASPANQMKLSEDATVALGLARTAIPFATSRAEEAEKWLRVLRMHGDVGAALQGLGVGEAPLEPDADDQPNPNKREDGREITDRVCQVASDLARCNDAPVAGTVHLLLAVVWVYDEDFDRVLRQRGSFRDELLSRLATTHAG